MKGEVGLESQHVCGRRHCLLCSASGRFQGIASAFGSYAMCNGAISGGPPSLDCPGPAVAVAAPSCSLVFLPPCSPSSLGPPSLSAIDAYCSYDQR